MTASSRHKPPGGCAVCKAGQQPGRAQRNPPGTLRGERKDFHTNLHQPRRGSSRRCCARGSVRGLSGQLGPPLRRGEAADGLPLIGCSHPPSEHGETFPLWNQAVGLLVFPRFRTSDRFSNTVIGETKARAGGPRSLCGHPVCPHPRCGRSVLHARGPERGLSRLSATLSFDVSCAVSRPRQPGRR